MIREDAKGRVGYAVGLDHIGSYWEHSNRWTHEHDYKTKLDLPAVLGAEGISNERYEKYKLLFDRLHAERVTFGGGGGRVPVTSILIYRAGLAVSGCAMELIESPIPPKSEGQRGSGDFVEITELGGGWYVSYDCT